MYVDYTGEAIALSAGAAVAIYNVAPYIAAGVAAVGASIIYMAEHRKKGTTNPANREKHQNGQKRKQTDAYGGEKGDVRRTPRKDKRK